MMGYPWLIRHGSRAARAALLLLLLTSLAAPPSSAHAQIPTYVYLLDLFPRRTPACVKPALERSLLVGLLRFKNGRADRKLAGMKVSLDYPPQFGTISDSGVGITDAAGHRMFVYQAHAKGQEELHWSVHGVDPDTGEQIDRSNVMLIDVVECSAWIDIAYHGNVTPPPEIRKTWSNYKERLLAVAGVVYRESGIIEGVGAGDYHIDLPPGPCSYPDVPTTLQLHGAEVSPLDKGLILQISVVVQFDASGSLICKLPAPSNGIRVDTPGSELASRSVSFPWSNLTVTKLPYNRRYTYNGTPIGTAGASSGYVDVTIGGFH